MARVTLEQILEEADVMKRVFTKMGVAYLLKFQYQHPNQKQAWCQRWKKVLSFLRNNFSSEYSKLIRLDKYTCAIVWIRASKWLVMEKIQNGEFDCFAKLFME